MPYTKSPHLQIWPNWSRQVLSELSSYQQGDASCVIFRLLNATCLSTLQFKTFLLLRANGHKMLSRGQRVESSTNKEIVVL